MRDKKTYIFGGLALSGPIMLEILWAYSGDYTGFQIVFYSILAVIMFVIGVWYFVSASNTRKQAKLDCSYIKDDGTGNTLNQFRANVASFFTSERITENMQLQYVCTQLYYNIFVLQKQRLDRLKVHLEFHAMHKPDEAYRKEETYFDGKYDIHEVEQEVVAKKIFYKDHKPVHLRSENEIAHYTLINAKTDEENRVICPNCGNASAKEDLIDGCDYCGTKFTVEDLGEKVSGFGFRDSAELAYQKFKDTRWDMMENVFWISTLIFSIFVIIIIAILMSDEAGESYGDPFNPILFTLSVFVVSGCFGGLFALAVIIGYVFVLMPLMEIVAHVRYNSKKRAEKIRKDEAHNQELQKKVRQFDELFSIEGFYLNIQNKLSTIIFSDTPEEIGAFCENDMRAYYTKYLNVIDYDVDRMVLKAYDIDGEYQVADVVADINLLELHGQKVKTKNSTVKMRVMKSKNCLTQAVGEPKVMRCRNCGSSLSYTNGLVCEYCEQKPDLKQYDWTIVSYHD